MRPGIAITTVLVLAMLLSGCARHQQTVARAQESSSETAAVVQQYSHSDNWLDNHPAVKCIAYACGILLIGAGLAALVVAAGV